MQQMRSNTAYTAQIDRLNPLFRQTQSTLQPHEEPGLNDAANMPVNELFNQMDSIMSRYTFNTIGADSTLRGSTQSRRYSGLTANANRAANISSQREPTRPAPVSISRYLQAKGRPEHTQTTAYGTGRERC